MRFEWPTVAGPEEVEETEGTPGWPPHAVEPTRPLVSAPPPTAAVEQLGPAQTGQAPGARRGGDRDLWPPPPLLVPPALPAPATGPAAADAPEAFAIPQPHPVAPVAHTARDRDAGPAEPAPGPADAPAPHPLPCRLAVPAAATAPAREAAAPACTNDALPRGHQNGSCRSGSGASMLGPPSNPSASARGPRARPRTAPSPGSLSDGQGWRWPVSNLLAIATVTEALRQFILRSGSPRRSGCPSSYRRMDRRPSRRRTPPSLSSVTRSRPTRTCATLTRPRARRGWHVADQAAGGSRPALPD